MLWSFQATSFVPHALVHSDDADNAPVRIGHGNALWLNNDVLINLDRHIPEAFGEYARILEVVVQDSTVLNDTREHWRHYKQLGHAPQRRELANA
jgi:DNA polymerase-3 subunit chi